MWKLCMLLCTCKFYSVPHHNDCTLWLCSHYEFLICHCTIQTWHVCIVCNAKRRIKETWKQERKNMLCPRDKSFSHRACDIDYTQQHLAHIMHATSAKSKDEHKKKPNDIISYAYAINNCWGLPLTVDILICNMRAQLMCATTMTMIQHQQQHL